MQRMIERRRVLLGGLFLLAAPSAVLAKDGDGSSVEKFLRRKRDRKPESSSEPVDESPIFETPDFDDPFAQDEQYYDPDLLPPPESETDFPIPPVSPTLLKPYLRRQTVQFESTEQPGTVIVRPHEHFLYQVEGNGFATRYGVGVGRTGFSWYGAATIAMKRRWPRWVPPREMVDRDERARQWVNGQPGGPDNPLGARALYLYSNGKDTLYRIHGTNDPKSIGKSVSSGCIRMLNEDVAYLFDRVKIGTRVVVQDF